MYAHTHTCPHTFANVYTKTIACQFPLKTLHFQNPPNPETQISRYKFKLNQNFNLKFVPRDTEESEFLDFVEFGDVAFSVETVITCHIHIICV